MNGGITFDNEKHTYDDFGLICTSLIIELPEMKQKKIELKGADGYLDLTDIFGRTLYGNRKIKAEFVLKEQSAEEWMINISNIANYLHGRKRKLVLESDPMYYYEGRITENHEKQYRPFSVVTIEADCAPYKKEVEDSLDTDWLWDAFSFEDGIIREYGNLEVNGSYTLLIIGREQIVVPVFYASAAMTVTYNGVTYDLIAGENKIYSIALGEGEHTLVFTGNGTVSVEYRGGRL